MTAETSLTWSVHEQFVAYVSSLEDGAINCGRGLRRNAHGFTFPGKGDSFEGHLEFTGHHGFLALLLGDPIIRRERGVLVLNVLDDETTNSRTDLVILKSPSTASGVTTFQEVLLTESGAELFFQRYQPGTLFAPVTLSQGNT